jgi:hypothetical protein
MPETKTQRSNCRFVVQRTPDGRSVVIIQLYQLSESTRLDAILSILESSDGALGNSGLAREKLSGELFCLSADFFQNFASTTLSYSRNVSCVGSRDPASAIIDRSGPFAQPHNEDVEVGSRSVGNQFEKPKN